MDKIKPIGKSVIQHGTENSRIYLMDLHPDDTELVLETMHQLSDKNQYSKLIVKIPAVSVPDFMVAGYRLEAMIPGYYNGLNDAFFMSRYPDPERSRVCPDQMKALEDLLRKPHKELTTQLPAPYSISPLRPKAAEQMAEVFRKVFDSYPFPVFDPDFLRQSMTTGETAYFGVHYEGTLIAISSAECQSKYQCAEMTDFAVLPAHRGKKLALYLLQFMEQHLSGKGYQTLYTIARLRSVAMNRTFQTMNYRYAGTLPNNTQISGAIESMNVWYRTLRSGLKK